MADSGDILRFRFGPYVLELASRRLLRDGQPVSIEPLVFDLLVFLARNRHRAVDKDELQDVLWPGRIVTETALTRAVMKARKAVDDDAGRQAVIKTVHGHGYHFVAEVEADEARPAGAGSAPEPASALADARAPGGRRRAGYALFFGAAALALAVALFVVLWPGRQAPTPRDAAPVPLDSQSIAVLPFANRSDLPRDRYFADGIQDDLLTSLAKVGSLKVISRTSVMRYRDSGQSIPEIAAELGVANILEGGIQRSAGQVRVHVQLIDARTDEHLWAETYDRELNAENLFAIQSDISNRVVDALQAALDDRERRRLEAPPTDNLEAYAEFVLGRQAITRRTTEALAAAEAHFEKAIDLDPGYALAYVGLADTLNLMGSYGTAGAAETMARRQELVDRALAIDPHSGEAYTALAALRVDQSRFEEAERHFREAIGYSPNYATAHHWYAYLLENTGRSEEALPVIRRALDLDPMAPILTVQYARVLWKLGRVEGANAALVEGVRRNPTFSGFYMNMATNLRELGRLGESMRWIRAGLALDETLFPLRVMECKRFLDFDDDGAAERCLDQVAEDFPGASAGNRVELYQYRLAFAGALDEARALAERYPQPFARIILGWNLFNNARYDELLALLRAHWPAVVDASAPGFEDIDALHAGVLAGFAFHARGEVERADAILDRALEHMTTIARVRGEGYGELDVMVHVLREDRARAITALREAIDAGWRDNWWRLRYPFYDPMRDEPEWAALLTGLEAEIARERAWYQAHADEPLF